MVPARAMRPSSPVRDWKRTAPSHEAVPNFCRYGLTSLLAGPGDGGGGP